MQDRGLFTMKTVWDCLQHFLRYIKSLKKRSFVVNVRKLCAIAVPMDQGLEKVNNKPAKGQGRIIVSCYN